jgi:hypothetical protein
MEEALLMPFSDISPLWIPIFAILGAFSVGIVAMVLRSREKERAHRERMFMAEKGIEIPKELYGVNAYVKEQKKPGNYRTARAWLLVLGIITIFIAVAAMIVVGVQSGIRDAIGAVVAIGIGISFLAAQWMLGRFAEQSKIE